MQSTFSASLVIPTILTLVLCGCGTSATNRGFETQSDAGNTPQTNGTTADASLGKGGDAGTSNTAGCSEAAKLVYVLSAENGLYSFAPGSMTFTKIGDISCPGTGGTPNSMAIDRKGTAWVNFSDGALFKVSTKDATCEASTYPTGQEGLLRFGLAFATNGESQDETLYLAANSGGLTAGGQGFWKLDLATMKVTRLGDWSGRLRGESAELTGTGDGHLFGFFTTSPATFARVDPATGATSSEKTLDGLRNVTAWAFSFWGGDFWFYTSVFDEPSKVTRLAMSGDGSLSTVKEDVGFEIVGAGVSTCAPTAPPR